MALTEDLSVFLADFGVICTSGAVTGLGLLDMPSELVADGVVLSTDYKLICLASEFGNLKYADTITVAGATYTVRETLLIDDGKFCEVMLLKP